MFGRATIRLGIGPHSSFCLLAQMHETMRKMFNPKLHKIDGNLLPFGGKKLIFLGDLAQM